MKRLMRIWMVLLILLVGDWTQSASSITRSEQPDDIQTVYQHFKERKDRDGLRRTGSWEQKRTEAIITDSHSIYRICNSRPQRLLSHHAQRNYRMQAKLQPLTFLSPYKSVKTGTHYWKITLPLLSVASCDYYVFALRHILC